MATSWSSLVPGANSPLASAPLTSGVSSLTKWALETPRMAEAASSSISLPAAYAIPRSTGWVAKNFSQLRTMRRRAGKNSSFSTSTPSRAASRMVSMPASQMVVNMSSLSSKYWNSEPLAMSASRAITFRLPAEKPRLPNSSIAAFVTRSRFSGGRFHQVSVGIGASYGARCCRGANDVDVPGVRPTIRSQPPVPRVLAGDVDRGLLLHRAAPRAAGVRGRYGAHRRARSRARRARLRRHLLEARSPLRRVAADAEVGGAVLLATPPRLAPADRAQAH